MSAQQLNTPELKAVLKTTTGIKGLSKAQATEHNQWNYGIGNSKLKLADQRNKPAQHKALSTIILTPQALQARQNSEQSRTDQGCARLQQNIDHIIGGLKEIVARR